MVQRKFTAMLVAGATLAGTVAVAAHAFAAPQAGLMRQASFAQIAKGSRVTGSQTMKRFEGSWQLTHLAGFGSGLAELDTALSGRSNIVIGADGKLSGTVGCNRFGTSFDLDDGAIAFTGVVATRRACHGPVWDAERGLFAAFRQAASYQVEGDTLTLMDSAGNAIARLARA